MKMDWLYIVSKVRDVVSNFQWTNIIIHPLISAVFPILSLYVENMGKGLFFEALAIAAVSFGFSLLAWLLFEFFIKNKRKSAIVVSAFFTLFFSYGHVISVFTTVLDKLSLLEKARFLVEGSHTLRVWVVVWLGIFVATIGIVVKIKSDLKLATKFLNVVALSLMLIVGVDFVVSGVNMYWPNTSTTASENLPQNDAHHLSTNLTFRQFLPLIRNSSSDENAEVEIAINDFIGSWQQEQIPTGSNLSGSSPDIYYIIVDAYARADILEEIYHFDNSEFLSYLNEKGFYVADRSTTNYPQTALSLSSSLNFMYLDDLVDQIGDKTGNKKPLQEMIKESKVFRCLREDGYTLVAFSSGYGPTEITEADVYMTPPDPWKMTEFQEALIMLTPFSAFPELRSDHRRDRITYALDHVADASQIDGPIFAFVHITAPHFPFIFDVDGKSIQPPRGVGNRMDYSYDEYVEGYRNQLAYITKELRITVDEILSRSPEPPIIILQSDHGPCAQLSPSWNIQATYLSERMSILNAYYFPSQNYAMLYEAISPVNTFRVVLNEYFSKDYEMLEDRCYFASWDRPYFFTDVTDEVLEGH